MSFLLFVVKIQIIHIIAKPIAENSHSPHPIHHHYAPKKRCLTFLLSKKDAIFCHKFRNFNAKYNFCY